VSRSRDISRIPAQLLNEEAQLEGETSDLREDVRAPRGLPPVAWGEKPWLPVNLAPSDFPQRDAIVEQSGRGRIVARE
jgi:hypothetical protein